MPPTPRGKRTAGPNGLRVTGKAANGEGSVYFDRANSLWIATYTLPGEVDPVGRPKIRKVTGATRVAVLERRSTRLENAANRPGVAVRSEWLSVHEYCQWWLDVVEVPRVRPSSLQAMRARLTRARLGHLAPMRLLDVRSRDVARWQQHLLTSLAPKTVADSRTALAQVFDAADHGVAEARTALGADAFAQRVAIGAAMDDDQAVAYLCRRP